MFALSNQDQHNNTTRRNVYKTVPDSMCRAALNLSPQAKATCLPAQVCVVGGWVVIIAVCVAMVTILRTVLIISTANRLSSYFSSSQAQLLGGGAGGGLVNKLKY